MRGQGFGANGSTGTSAECLIKERFQFPVSSQPVSLIIAACTEVACSAIGCDRRLHFLWLPLLYRSGHRCLGAALLGSRGALTPEALFPLGPFPFLSERSCFCGTVPIASFHSSIVVRLATKDLRRREYNYAGMMATRHHIWAT